MKIRIHLFALLMLFSGLTMTATTASAKANSATAALTTDQQQARATAIKQRVEEIKAMNFSSMSSAERKDIRHELKGMNKELRSMDPVIYISGGALILIIILLILLL